MRLWSLQPVSVGLQIQHDGIAFARPDFDLHWGQHPDAGWGFRQAYDWMSTQMASRIGPPPPGAIHPMWAWARPPRPTGRGAPDLRSMRDDQPGVLLELEVPPTSALLSDHGSWHHVLNGWPLAFSEPLSEQIEARLRTLCASLGTPMSKHGILDAAHFSFPEIRSFLGHSWTPIFRVEPLHKGVSARLDIGPDGDPEWVGGDDICVQACLWSIQRSQVVSSTPYAARKPRAPSS